MLLFVLARGEHFNQLCSPIEKAPYFIGIDYLWHVMSVRADYPEVGVGARTVPR